MRIYVSNTLHRLTKRCDTIMKINEVKQQWSNIACIIRIVGEEAPRTLLCMVLKIITQAAIPLWAVTVPMQIIRLLEKQVMPETLLLSMCQIGIVTIGLQVFATWTSKRSETLIGLVRTGIFRVKMINKLLSMKYSAYASGEKRAVVDRAWLSVWSNNFGVEGSLRNMMLLAGAVVTLIGMASTLWSFSPWLPILLLLFSLADQRMIRQNNRVKLKYRDENMAIDSRIQYVHETLQDVAYGKEMRVTGMGRYMTQWHEKLMADKLYVFEKVRQECLVADIWMLILSIAREAMIYGYLIYDVWRGRTAIADFSLYFAAGLNFSGLIVQIIRYYEAMLGDSAGVRDIRTMLAFPDEIDDSSTVFYPDGGIAFRDVSYRYPNAECLAVDSFSYTFTPGKRVAIVGENGSGKTTLVKLICGLLTPTSGIISSSGNDMGECVGIRRYKLFSVVFQDINQYALTLGENVAMDSTYSIENVWQLLDSAGLDPNSFPRSLDTMLRKDFDPEGIDLSGGQLQALAIARALYRTGSCMIIMDEPTAALDPIAEKRLYGQLRDMTQGRTTVFISHRLASTRFCDEILVMKEGHLEEVGTHEALMARKGYYYQLFDAQSEFYRVQDAKKETIP